MGQLARLLHIKNKLFFVRQIHSGKNLPLFDKRLYVMSISISSYASYLQLKILFFFSCKDPILDEDTIVSIIWYNKLPYLDFRKLQNSCIRQLTGKIQPAFQVQWKNWKDKATSLLHLPLNCPIIRERLVFLFLSFFPFCGGGV